MVAQPSFGQRARVMRLFVEEQLRARRHAVVGDRERRQIGDAQRPEIDFHHPTARDRIKTREHRRFRDRLPGRRWHRHAPDEPDRLTGRSLPGHRAGRRAGIQPTERERCPKLVAAAVHDHPAHLAGSGHPHGLASALEGRKGLAASARVEVATRWRDVEDRLGGGGSDTCNQSSEAQQGSLHRSETPDEIRKRRRLSICLDVFIECPVVYGGLRESRSVEHN